MPTNSKSMSSPTPAGGDMTHTIFVIPAKRSSLRAPGKNLALAELTIDAALGAAQPGDEVILSTDWPLLAKIAGKATVHRRGKELSEPGVSATQVTASVVADSHEDATVVQLLPTSPFRQARHVTEALALYHSRDPGWSTVLSVTPVARASLCYDDSAGMISKSEQYLPRGARDGEWDKPHPTFISNGAIQITCVKLLNSFGSFWGIPKRIAYVMDEYAGFDVDTQAQFDMALQLLAKNPKVFIQ